MCDFVFLIFHFVVLLFLSVLYLLSIWDFFHLWVFPYPNRGSKDRGCQIVQPLEAPLWFTILGYIHKVDLIDLQVLTGWKYLAGWNVAAVKACKFQCADSLFSFFCCFCNAYWGWMCTRYTFFATNRDQQGRKSPGAFIEFYLNSDSHLRRWTCCCWRITVPSAQVFVTLMMSFKMLLTG